MTGGGSEAGGVTGTPDKDYNLIGYTEGRLSNALRLETYIQDAERDGDSELAEAVPQGAGGRPQGRRAGQAAPGQPDPRLRRGLVGRGDRVIGVGGRSHDGLPDLRRPTADHRRQGGGRGLIRRQTAASRAARRAAGPGSRRSSA